MTFNSADQINEASSKSIITNTLIKDIPNVVLGQRPSYCLNKGGRGQNWFKQLENGYDSLQIRIWYDYAFNDTSQLGILQKTGGV